MSSPPKAEVNPFPIARRWLNGHLDYAEVDSCGIIRLIGWSKEDLEAPDFPVVSIDGEPVPFLHFYRFTRDDVAADSDAMFSQTGLALNYLLAESSLEGATTLSISISAGEPIEFKTKLAFIHPHYRNLMDSREVLHREHIYGSGPPNRSVHPEVLELARHLQGPVLDFGCGRGALVAQLRQLGIEAYGLELDSAMIRKAIAGEDAGLITLYDGSFPSPFNSGQFRSVICSEVLEHIPLYAAAIQEIARVAAEKVVFTVPDASAIPIGFRHGVVPWHLLEGTHVNFFSQRSLEIALAPHFAKVRFGRVGLSHFNDSLYYVSLAAVCLK